MDFETARLGAGPESIPRRLAVGVEPGSLLVGSAGAIGQDKADDAIGLDDVDAMDGDFVEGLFLRLAGQAVNDREREEDGEKAGINREKTAPGEKMAQDVSRLRGTGAVL